MDYKKIYNDIESLIDRKDTVGFINYIQELDRKDEFETVFEYIDDIDYKNKKNLKEMFKNYLIETKPALEIFIKNLPYEVFADIFISKKYSEYRPKLNKDMISKILFSFSKQNDDLPYFPDYLKIAMENKDDELVKAFYDLYFNHIGYNEKITIVENLKSNIEKLLKENYNQYSNAILQDLLDVDKRIQEQSLISEKIKESYKNNIKLIKPVFDEILFDYVDSKDEMLYGKKVILFDKNKKYNLSYDFFIQKIIQISRAFYKAGINYYMQKFLMKTIGDLNCILPYLYVYRREYNIKQFQINYDNYKKILFDITEDINQKQKSIIDDMVQRMSNCSYGFQPLGIFTINEKNQTEDGHACTIFFENINNNINIYFYDPHGTDTISQSYRKGLPEFLIYLVEQMNKFYPNKNIKIEFKYSGCLTGLQTSSRYDIGMCESWSTLWIYLVFKTLRYIKDNNINLSIKDWLPLIEEYFTEEIDSKKVYNLLISFMSQLYLQFNNENVEFGNHVKKLLKKYSQYEDKGLIIEDITGKESYELEKLKKEYKEYVNKLAIKKEDFLKRQEAYKKVKSDIKEEEKKVSEKEGKKLFENCNVDLDCATKCCKTMGRAKICVPEKECKIRHIYGKGLTRKRE
jgi:hypothetical protein